MKTRPRDAGMEVPRPRGGAEAHGLERQGRPLVVPAPSWKRGLLRAVRHDSSGASPLRMPGDISRSRGEEGRVHSDSQTDRRGASQANPSLLSDVFIIDLARIPRALTRTGGFTPARPGVQT